MTSPLRNAARSGFEAVKVLAVLVMFLGIGVLVASPLILGALWYAGLVSFEATAIVLLILAAYGGSA